MAALWAYRERLTEAIATAGIPHKIDVAVPAGELGAFCAEAGDVVRAAGPTRGGPARLIVFGHIGVGNLHVNVLGPEPGDTEVDAAVARLAAAHGGSAAAEHGVGRAKTGWLSWTRSAAEISAMRSIKTALDPAGLLNPGVLLPPAGPRRRPALTRRDPPARRCPPAPARFPSARPLSDPCLAPIARAYSATKGP